MTKQPNILILYCDQMQHDRMGFVDKIAHTPNLDELAAEGCHFTHAITQQGQCVPSRAVLLTGQSAHECGVMINYGFFNHRNMLTSKNRTFAHELRDNSYTTAWFGKGHIGSPLVDLGFDHGDTFDEHTESATSGRALDPEDTKRLNCDYVPDCIAVDYKATEDAVNFVREHQAEKPLCLMMSLHFPHPPFFSERRFIDKFPPEDMPLPDSFHIENFDGKPSFAKDRSEHWCANGYDENSLRKDLADYYSMIAAMDDHFGQVINEFKRQGIWENTIVLFTADHGDMMGAHAMRLKGTFPYDELYRVPCIMKLPESMPQPKRQVIDDLVSSQAYAGTLLKLAGVDVPESFTGGDFVDSFYRTSHPKEENIFFEHYGAHWGGQPFYGIRTRKWKYVYYYGNDKMEELYHLDDDPYELHNLAQKPECEIIKTNLAKQVTAWWQNTDGKAVNYYESAEFKANTHNAPVNPEVQQLEETG